MIIWKDSREKPRATRLIDEEFERQLVTVIPNKLPFGDYMNADNPKLFIDRKQSLLEVSQNVVQDHARFVREIERCNSCGCHLIILVEHGGDVRSLEDVINWKNPRLKKSPMAVTGERLYKIMYAMQNKYGIEWQFCDKRHTGKRIIELLGGE